MRYTHAVAIIALLFLPCAAVGAEGDALDARAAELRERLGSGFHVVVEPPFVVAGDEPAAVVERRAVQTVRWAVTRLKADFFEHNPDEVLEIYLFRDRESYETHTQRLFDIEPRTPFGFYSHRNRALIMNIATGGGTLVHEIVHPFMHRNFPQCPAWFNEGLGSLYEQASERDGHIIGLTNWRLAGLQEAIEAKETVPLDELLDTTDNQFYGESARLHYAQARYLCYYLQEQGKLVDFYHAFTQNQDDDPTGIETLKTTLAEADLQAFQRRWERWVMTLRFED